ncbi:MAG: hypothetical protein R3B96_15990 [Pirellulaceae bacterium]
MPTEGVAALDDAGQNAEMSNEFERSINVVELSTRGLIEAEVGETAEFVGATWVAVLPSNTLQPVPITELEKTNELFSMLNV